MSLNSGKSSSSSTDGIETAMTTHELTEITRAIVRAVRKHGVDSTAISKTIQTCIQKKINSYEVCELCTHAQHNKVDACKRVPKYRCASCRRSMCSEKMVNNEALKFKNKCVECVKKR